MEENKIFIECDCHTHVLKVEYDKENSLMETYEMFEIALFNYGNHSEKPSLWWRIKYVFKHILKGNLYSDQIILNKEEATKLYDFLKIKLNK